MTSLAEDEGLKKFRRASPAIKDAGKINRGLHKVEELLQNMSVEELEALGAKRLTSGKSDK